MKSVEQLQLRDDGDGVVVGVKVVPGASRDRIVGVLGGAVKITTAAAAEKGKANDAVARTLAKALGLRRRDIELIAGQTSPRKTFRVAGMTAQEVLEALRRL
jgi:uncharacterized protein (TIGR00251 family)